jgi:hypothetical protein
MEAPGARREQGKRMIAVALDLIAKDLARFHALA